MEKPIPRILTKITFVVILVFMTVGCSTLEQTPNKVTQEGLNLPELSEDSGRVWLEIDPIQGLNSPWREWLWEEWIGRYYSEWVQTYQDKWIDAQDYPDCSSSCEHNNDLLPDRACMIECLVKHYYLMQEVTVFNVEVSTYQEKFGHAIAICEAEDCPAGYTLYVQIAETDIDRMLELGYRNIVTSCESIPQDIYYYGCSQ
jgi:hypothetical protein